MDRFVRGLFSFKGRMGRASFFVFSLIVFMFVVTCGGLWVALPSHGGDLLLPTVFLVCLLSTWANLAVVAKRLHDVDLSAWNMIWMIAPTLLPFFVAGRQAINISFFVSIAVSLYLLFMPGTRTPNRFDYPA